MAGRFKIPDGNITGIVDFDRITSICNAVNHYARPVENDIVTVIDPDQAVIPGIRQVIGPGVEDNPGIAVDIKVIFHIQIGLAL